MPAVDVFRIRKPNTLVREAGNPYTILKRPACEEADGDKDGEQTEQERVRLPGLRREREARGLSQRELDLLADVTNVTISRLENNYPANQDTARKLARALGVELEDLYAENAERVEELERQLTEARDDRERASLYAQLGLAKGGTKTTHEDLYLEAIEYGRRREQEERRE